MTPTDQPTPEKTGNEWRTIVEVKSLIGFAEGGLSVVETNPATFNMEGVRESIRRLAKAQEILDSMCPSPDLPPASVKVEAGETDVQRLTIHVGRNHCSVCNTIKGYASDGLCVSCGSPIGIQAAPPSPVEDVGSEEVTAADCECANQIGWTMDDFAAAKLIAHHRAQAVREAVELTRRQFGNGLIGPAYEKLLADYQFVVAARDAAESALTTATKERDALTQWKKEQLHVTAWWQEIDDRIRAHKDVRIGDFVPKTTLRFLEERDRYKTRIAELEEEKSFLDWLIQNAKIIHWPKDGSYPIEHAPAALKDGMPWLRQAYEAALSTSSKPTKEPAP